MNRLDLILYHVREALKTEPTFEVVNVYKNNPQLSSVFDVYAYVIKDTLNFNFQMEDGGISSRSHYVDIGLVVRWKTARDTQGEGLGTTEAHSAVDKVETCLSAYELPQTSGNHTLRGWALTETSGYYDEGRELGEVNMIITVHA